MLNALDVEICLRGFEIFKAAKEIIVTKLKMSSNCLTSKPKPTCKMRDARRIVGVSFLPPQSPKWELEIWQKDTTG